MSHPGRAQCCLSNTRGIVAYPSFRGRADIWLCSADFGRRWLNSCFRTLPRSLVTTRCPTRCNRAQGQGTGPALPKLERRPVWSDSHAIRTFRSFGEPPTACPHTLPAAIRQRAHKHAGAAGVARCATVVSRPPASSGRAVPRQRVDRHRRAVARAVARRCAWGNL